MRYKTKLLLDRVLGTPALFFLKALVYTVGRIAFRNHTVTGDNVRRIALLKIVGMGSIIEFSASLKALRTCYPNASILFVSSVLNKELLDLYEEFIDETVFIDDRSFFRLLFSTPATILKLAFSRIDVFLNLEVFSGFSTLISVFSLARNRFGFYLRSSAFRKGLDTHHVFYNQHKNIREIYARMVEAAGCPLPPSLGPLRLEIPPESETKVRDYLEEKNIHEFILINVNASELSLERRWQEEKWIALIERLLGSFNLPILLSGSPGEREYVQTRILDKIDAELKQRVTNAAGELSLKEFAHLVSINRFFVTVDSGPYHFGLAMGAKMVSLWGPESPRHYALDRPGLVSLYKDVYCSPCVKQTDTSPCKGDNFCMKDITVDEVMESIHALEKSG